jgi:hypothetical protein
MIFSWNAHLKIKGAGRQLGIALVLILGNERPFAVR